MKALVRQGIGITKRQAKVITEEEEDILWAKSLLGSDSPQQLSDTLIYLIGLNFALRAGDEHRFLQVGETSQLKVMQNVNEGSKFLVYTEDMSKTNRGSLKHRKCERKVVKVSQNNERPERCLVRLYEMYLNLRPRNGTCQAFYLRPLRYAKTDVWFADVPIGVHTLTQTISRFCKAAGFSGFYTNHSLRATTATRLYDAGLDELDTSHQLSVVIRTSEQLTAKVDSVVQRKSRKVTSHTDTTSTPPATGTVTVTTPSEDLKESTRGITMVLQDGPCLSVNL
ncbi:zinc finger MYM-type protein 2-like [Haliotis rubra]|uniref:zinc finger MYM-type protein 2-like n=1 Tax=Haliotis rubra TaxID=36100 RepID=UPI001EE5CC17|nr:zinc finger MYM-type protein 2-like [Haliotis rubra]